MITPTVIIIYYCLFYLFTTASVQKVTKIARQCFFYMFSMFCQYGCSIQAQALAVFLSARRLHHSEQAVITLRQLQSFETWAWAYIWTQTLISVFQPIVLLHSIISYHVIWISYGAPHPQITGVGYWHHHTVRLSDRLSVTLCIVALRVGVQG